MCELNQKKIKALKDKLANTDNDSLKKSIQQKLDSISNDNIVLK